MKFLFCVENETDAQVFEVLLTNILGTTVQADLFPYRRDGWHKVLSVAPKIARKAHRDGLHGALFAIDNDGAEPIHSEAHETNPNPTCRLCKLKAEARIDEPLAWPRPGLPPLRYLFAVPVQTLETWLLHAQGHDFKGAADSLGRDGSGRRQLKKLLYGVEQPDSATMIKVARPLAEKLNPDALARKSASFAHLLSQLRAADSATG